MRSSTLVRVAAAVADDDVAGAVVEVDLALARKRQSGRSDDQLAGEEVDLAGAGHRTARRQLSAGADLKETTQRHLARSGLQYCAAGADTDAAGSGAGQGPADDIDPAQIDDPASGQDPAAGPLIDGLGGQVQGSPAHRFQQAGVDQIPSRRVADGEHACSLDRSRRPG